jgi:uncharacterized membrane protein
VGPSFVQRTCDEAWDKLESADFYEAEVCVISRFVFMPGIAGAVFLVAGLFLLQRELRTAAGLDKLIALGSTFVAAALATFGAEHLVAARSLAELVPAWMPARLFWAYLVGIALMAAALSLIAKKCTRLSVPLLAAMLFCFVLMIHIPNVVAHPRERLYWTVALRETLFGGASLALAGFLMAQLRPRLSRVWIHLGRWLVAIPLIFFGIEYFLHPEIAPGVPLLKVTPSWVPLPFVWATLTGILLVIGGLAILLNRYARPAAAGLGLLMTLITLFLYAPILAMAARSSQIEALNYVADTLLFAGTLLFLARALYQEPLAPSSSTRRG